MQRFIGLVFPLFILVLSYALPVQAADEPDKITTEAISKDHFDAYKELAETKLGAAKESLQKDIQNFSTRVDGQDKRIESQDARIADIGFYLTILGGILTMLALIGGWFGLVTVSSRAKEEARGMAKLWFEEREQHITQQIEGFKTQVAALSEQVKQQADEHCNTMQGITDDVKQLAETAMQQMQTAKQDLLRNADKSMAQPTKPDAKAAAALTTLAESIRKKPSSEYTFTDWRTLAFAAEEQEQPEDALFYWRQAIKAPDANEQQQSQGLFQVSTNLFRLNNYQEVIATIDTLLQRYGNSDVPKIQKVCANALHNKGVTLGRMGNLVEAVDCCDELLTRYDTIENPEIQAQYRSALVNSVEYLLVLGRHTEANQRIQDAFKHIDNTNQTYAIMPFLRWLMETDTPSQQVLTAIHALAPTVEFAWSSDDIRPLVDKLPATRKTQAECFIAFFEQHHEITKLEACLAAHEPI